MPQVGLYSAIVDVKDKSCRFINLPWSQNAVLAIANNSNGDIFIMQKSNLLKLNDSLDIVFALDYRRWIDGLTDQINMEMQSIHFNSMDCDSKYLYMLEGNQLKKIFQVKI
jgi:hypothetical protein